MTSDRLVPRLPDELVVEVFRNRILSVADLVECALVSRRYLSAVREYLYEEVEVTLQDHTHYRFKADGVEVIHREPNPCQDKGYSIETARLLRTLMDDKRLGQLVRSLTFRDPGQTSWLIPPRSAIAASSIQALSTFLCLAPKRIHVRLRSPWTPTLEDFKLLAYYKSVTRLSVGSLTETEVRTLARNFPHLLRLDIAEFAAQLPLGPRPTFDQPRDFEVLDLRDARSSACIPFIVANLSTLRSLTINVAVARDVDYAQLNQLVSLHIVGPEYESDTDIYPGHEQFWTSLCGSPSLVNLTLECRCSRSSPDAGLYSIFGGDPCWPAISIPTLRRLRFKENVVLDWAYLLLSSPLADTLSRVGIPPTSELLYGGPDKLRLRAIAAMCELKEIALYFADD